MVKSHVRFFSCPVALLTDRVRRSSRARSRRVFMAVVPSPRRLASPRFHLFREGEYGKRSNQRSPRLRSETDCPLHIPLALEMRHAPRRLQSRFWSATGIRRGAPVLALIGARDKAAKRSYHLP